MVDLNGASAGVDGAVSIAPDNQPHQIFPDVAISDVEFRRRSCTAQPLLDGRRPGLFSLAGNGDISVSLVADGVQLTGDASASEYASLISQATLQSWYSETPTFTLIVNDGTADSATATELVTIAPPSTWDVWTDQAGDLAWHSASNWTLGVPTTGSIVYFDQPGKTVTLNLADFSDLATIADLQIYQGSELDVTTGDAGPASLTVADVLFNAGTIQAIGTEIDLPTDIVNYGQILAGDPSVINIGNGTTQTVIDNTGANSVIGATGVDSTVIITNAIVTGGEIEATASGSIIQLDDVTLNDVSIHATGGGSAETFGAGSTTVLNGSSHDTPALISGPFYVNGDTTLEVQGYFQDGGRVYLERLVGSPSYALDRRHRHALWVGQSGLGRPDSPYGVITGSDASATLIIENDGISGPDCSATASSASTTRPAVRLPPTCPRSASPSIPEPARSPTKA